MINQNKVNLILLIAQSFSDEQCANILASFTNKIANKGGMLLANSAQWDESKHPRANDGRFAQTGSGRDDMTHAEAERWDRIGKGAYDKRLTKKKAEISKLQRRQGMYPKGGETWNDFQSKIVKGQRELAELERDIKLEKRTALESKVSKRVNQKKIKQYRDLDDEIDYIEEKYADRNPESPTQGEVVFPETKKGQKQKAKYERLIVERDELNEEIDWEMVDKETPEDDDDEDK